MVNKNELGKIISKCRRNGITADVLLEALETKHMYQSNDRLSCINACINYIFYHEIELVKLEACSKSTNDWYLAKCTTREQRFVELYKLILELERNSAKIADSLHGIENFLYSVKPSKFDINSYKQYTKILTFIKPLAIYAGESFPTSRAPIIFYLATVNFIVCNRYLRYKNKLITNYEKLQDAINISGGINDCMKYIQNNNICKYTDKLHNKSFKVIINSENYSYKAIFKLPVSYRTCNRKTYYRFIGGPGKIQIKTNFASELLDLPNQIVYNIIYKLMQSSDIRTLDHSEFMSDDDKNNQINAFKPECGPWFTDEETINIFLNETYAKYIHEIYKYIGLIPQSLVLLNDYEFRNGQVVAVGRSIDRNMYDIGLDDTYSWISLFNRHVLKCKYPYIAQKNNNNLYLYKLAS